MAEPTLTAANVTPILNPNDLPPEAARLWTDLTTIVEQREFQGGEQPIPGIPLSPLHRKAWELSDELVDLVPGFAMHRLLRATLARDAYRLPEAEHEAKAAVALAPGAAAPHALLKQILALRDGLAEGEMIYSQATKYFQLAPFHDAALYMTGDMKHRYPEEAVAAFYQHLGANPSAVPVALVLAELLVDLERYDDAEAILAPLSQQFPDAAEVQALYGGLLAERGQMEEAYAAFQMAMALDPYHARARVNAARALAEMGDYKGGLELLREAAEDHQGDADFNILRGDLAAAVGANDEAAAAYIRALAADPDDPEDVEEIERALQSLGAWNDTNVRLQYLLAERALDEGEGLRAIKHLSNIKAAGVDTRELYLRMAEAHNAMNLLDDPLNFLMLAKSKKRRTYDTHGVEDASDARLDLIMLSLLIGAGRYSPKEAAEKLQPFHQLKKYEREPESYWVVLAGAWQEAGDLEKSAEALAQAIRGNPLDLPPWIELAGVLHAKGDLKGSVQALERAWHAGAKTSEVATMMAIGYEGIKAPKWAKHYAEEAELRAQVEAELEGEEGEEEDGSGEE